MLRNFHIETKSITDIQIPDPKDINGHYMAFVLIEDYSIFAVNLLSEVVVGHFRPTIMMCDSSLSLDLHSSMRYMMETTKGGYIILWKLNENF